MTNDNDPTDRFTERSRRPMPDFVTVTDLATLDEAEMIEGYWDGYRGGPKPGNDRSRLYLRGWIFGAVDGKHRKEDDAQAMLAASCRCRDEIEEKEVAEMKDDWRPIETAPKDGTKVLMFPSPHGFYAGYWIGHWTDLYGGVWYMDDIGHLNGMWAPTHWMPLPPPPAGE